MSQMPYPQQYPQMPQPLAPGYPQPYAQPAPPAYPAPQVPQQGYAVPAQQPPVQPLANGSIDEYYNQPSTGGGPSISWKDKPLGTAYAGIIARDVTNADIQQQTHYQTKQPEFYRDGSPKFAMKVPLKVQPSAEFPEGEATLYVHGRMRDELVRAMSEAGVSGAPLGGAGLVVTLVDKKPSGQGMNPANIFQITYTPPQGSPAPAPAQPVQQAQASTPAAPAVPVQQAPVQAATVAQPMPAQVPQQQQQAPAQAPQPPANLSPEQAELLARLTGGQG